VSWSTHERIAPLTWNSPCEDYRLEDHDRYKRMTLAADEFIRRFLIHVSLPAPPSIRAHPPVHAAVVA